MNRIRSCLKTRKGSVTIIIVFMIIVLVSGGVIYGVVGKLMGLIGSESNEKACTLSAILSSQTKVWGYDLLKLDCPMKLRTIELEEIEGEQGVIDRQIREFVSMDKDAYEDVLAIAEYEGVSVLPELDKKKNPISVSKDIAMELAFNNIILDEMAECWGKLGEGKLDLFSSWYGKNFEKESILQLIGMEDPPRTCVICSTLKFTPKLVNNLNGMTDFPTEIDSLTTWSRVRLMKKTYSTYFNYLMDEIHDDVLFVPEVTYSYDEPMSIIFMRVSESQLVSGAKGILNGVFYVGSVANTLFDWKPFEDDNHPVDTLIVVPFSKAGPPNCNYLANDPPELSSRGLI